MDFTNNNIKALPDIAGSYTLLEEFLFSHNMLTEFPDFIGQLLNLRVIDVSHNQIDEIPDSCRNLLKLETLIVSHNNIEELPLFLCTLPKLSFLAVANNPLKGYTEEDLSDTTTGSSKILNRLRKKLDIYLLDDAVLPPNISEGDRKFVRILKEAKKQSLDDFSVKMPVKPDNIPRKFVSRALEPKCERKPTVIRKIADGIWCGMEDGSVYHWDGRVSFNFIGIYNYHTNYMM